MVATQKPRRRAWVVGPKPQRRAWERRKGGEGKYSPTVGGRAQCCWVVFSPSLECLMGYSARGRNFKRVRDSLPWKTIHPQSTARVVIGVVVVVVFVVVFVAAVVAAVAAVVVFVVVVVSVVVSVGAVVVFVVVSALGLFFHYCRPC